MNIGEWESTTDLNRTYGTIRALGLEKNLAELETFGLTVVEGAAPATFISRLRDALLQSATKRGLIDPPTSAVENPSQYKGVGELLYYMLFEDRVFEEAVTNPSALALISYLLGESCLLSSLTGMVKGPTNERSVLHTDNGMIPSPFPRYAQVANATWVLTDYTREDGCLLYVPGSHLLCRHPTEGERRDEDSMVPVEASAGSLIVWHGNLWHAAFPKQTPGLRLNLIMLFCRMHCITQEDFVGRVPPGLLERNPPRLRKLLGEHITYGWMEDGPDFSTEDRRKYLGLQREASEILYD